jgi:probable HAF family extracellular repeat protein
MKNTNARLLRFKITQPLIIFLLVGLSCLGAGNTPAQTLRFRPAIGSSDQTASSELQKPTGALRTLKHQNVDPDHNNLTTIPHWSGTFNYHEISYHYTMVGTDPDLGSATTVVPTYLIPLRFVFADGSVVDAGTEMFEGQTAIHAIGNSPVFQPFPFKCDGVMVGNTQYPDAFQRANFWNYVSTRSKDYHVLLGKPTVLATQTINVPAGQGGYFPDPFGSGAMIPYVDPFLLDESVQAFIRQLGISPRTLPIFVTGDVVAGGLAYHGVITGPAGAQTYIVTCYFGQTSSFSMYEGPDVMPVSHEINEWMDDPFLNNFTPGWDDLTDNNLQCDSDIYYRFDLLEACDAIAALPNRGITALSTSPYVYHLEDTLFLDFFRRSVRSSAAGGQFSFFGLATAPAYDCTGHLEVGQTLFAFPGAVATVGHGINNLGEVVGYYFDASFNRHGFLFDGKVFASIDLPGATDTAAQKVNDSGLVVGWFDKADGVPHGFSYKNGVYTAIDFPGSIDTIAEGVNAEGDVVGAYDDTNFITHGFLLHNGRYLRTDAPYALQTELTSINDEGQIAGITWDDQFNGPYLGLVKDGMNFTMMHFPGAQFTYPFSINNSSMLTGQFFDADGYGDGFVTLFGFPYEIYGFVFGNNEKGQIAGTTYNSNGQQVGFTAQLPTKPADQ